MRWMAGLSMDSHIWSNTPSKASQNAKCQLWTSIFYAFMEISSNSNFYCNVTEWLASTGGMKFSKLIKKIIKRRTKCFLKSFCTSVRKKDDTLSIYKSLSMKSIWEPPLNVSFARCRFSLSLTSLVLRQIKYCITCKRPQEDGWHFRHM